jgi:hypothetical protein
MLGDAIDCREEYARERGGIAMPDQSEQAFELRAHHVRPVRELVAEPRRAGLETQHVAQQPEIAPFAHDLEAATDHAFEAVAWCSGVGGGAERGGDIAHAGKEDLTEQVILAVEVIVEEPLSDAGFPRDVADGRAVEAEAHEGRARRGEEALLAFGAERAVLQSGTGHLVLTERSFNVFTWREDARSAGGSAERSTERADDSPKQARSRTNVAVVSAFMIPSPRFPRAAFAAAGIYGLLVMAPQYWMADRIARDNPPPITHVEYFYGFIGVVIAWQLVFLLIAHRPAQYCAIMLVAVVEKLAFGVPAVVLYAQHRLAMTVLGFGLVDLLLAVLFTIAYVLTNSSR